MARAAGTGETCRAGPIGRFDVEAGSALSYS